MRLRINNGISDNCICLPLAISGHPLLRELGGEGGGGWGGGTKADQGTQEAFCQSLGTLMACVNAAF